MRITNLCEDMWQLKVWCCHPNVWCRLHILRFFSFACVLVYLSNFLFVPEINSFVRAIDWFTKGFGPVAVGQMFFDLEQLVVAAIIGLWNIVSFSLELFILWRLYKSYPKLAVKVLPNEKDHASSGMHSVFPLPVFLTKIWDEELTQKMPMILRITATERKHRLKIARKEVNHLHWPIRCILVTINKISMSRWGKLCLLNCIFFFWNSKSEMASAANRFMEHLYTIDN